MSDPREREVTAARLAALEACAEALPGLCTTRCREWLIDAGRCCGAPAEFVLWGRLIHDEGLGPRCYDHAAKWLGHDALRPRSSYALIDLRPGLAALAQLAQVSK